ncbi:MAG: mitochondrial fission ELM1 family protein [Candidatus Competibacter sp.]|nr:mitochondrial fission ELM1 family protein [Candidatus Competibacter sp.]MDG4583290.1 mitochondrial fission ELM1 family protein [Candidatus Competibacter sp.]
MRPLVVWRFSDGKAGHDNQSQGLTEALARLRPVEIVTPQCLSSIAALLALAGGRLTAWRTLPAPDLVVGAGHGTHLSLLAAGRRRRARAVVLMRPSLPLALFDLCLIPEHDTPPLRANVFVTRGALNRIQPSSHLDPRQGLLLIGGPSAHFGWDDAGLRAQIAAVLAVDPAVHWTLTTSRRTPASFLAAGHDPADARLTVVPVAATGPDWLPAQLARAGQVWVSADSVSMVYEALTAGAAVGVLEVPRKRSSRISRGLDKLAGEGWITPFADWQRHPCLKRPTQTFNEAERCARWIAARWFA